MYSFGRNQFGQLGHSKLETYNKPKKIKELENVNIIQVACGKNHSLFLTDTGVVYACGDMTSGQLGIGTTKQQTVTKPIRIQYDGSPIVKIGCGADFSAILDIDGNLYTFGNPEFGQLGKESKLNNQIHSTNLCFVFKVTTQTENTSLLTPNWRSITF